MGTTFKGKHDEAVIYSWRRTLTDTRTHSKSGLTGLDNKDTLQDVLQEKLVVIFSLFAAR
jgi:hypothetical protein